MGHGSTMRLERTDNRIRALLVALIPSPLLPPMLGEGNNHGELKATEMFDRSRHRMRCLRDMPPIR